MLIEKSVLFVEGTQGFVNQAIVNNLENAGLTVIRAGQELSEISPHCDEAEVFLFYPAGSISRIELVMDYLLEVVREEGKTLCIVGDEHYVAAAKRLDTDNQVLGVYERPVNTAALIADIRRIIDYKKESERPRQILVIDDDPDFLSIIGRWLKVKYQADGVRSGMEALFYLNRRRPDLILLDYDMPDMDGYQIMEKIRRNPDTVHVPIIFLTGKNDRESVMKILKRKPDGYLLKSMTKEQLLDTLERFFEQSYYAAHPGLTAREQRNG